MEKRMKTYANNTQNPDLTTDLLYKIGDYEVLLTLAEQEIRKCGSYMVETCIDQAERTGRLIKHIRFAEDKAAAYKEQIENHKEDIEALKKELNEFKEAREELLDKLDVSVGILDEQRPLNP